MTFPVPRQGALSSFALSSLALAISAPGAFAAASSSEPALAAVVITATRAPQAAVDVLSDHVTISSDDIVRSGAISVAELLQQQRGIQITRNGGPGTSSTVYIRGAEGKQSVVLIDGVRIGSSTTGTANWSALALANVDHIEIVYGPLATMYGADAIGGVVQIFTRRGAGPARVSAAIGAGSDKARSAEFTVAGASEGEHSISYAFTLAREKDSGFSATVPGNFGYNPDPDGYDKDSASGQLAIQLAPGHEAGLLYLHSHLKSQYDNGASSFDVRSVQNQDNIAAFSRHQLTRDWRLSLQAAETRDSGVNISSAAASGTSVLATRQQSWSAQNDIAIGSHLLQIVAERREEKVISGSTAALNTSRATNSVAAALSFKQGAHLGSISARHDNISEYGGQTTGGAAYGYRITPTLRANASIGTSFRAPTFNELYFPGFGVSTNRPEEGKNVEAGLYYSDGRSEASAVYYHNRLTDLLVNTTPCPVEAATHAFGCAYNVNRATLEGLSVGGRTRLGAFDLTGSVDWQDPRDDTTGKNLARRARRHAKLGVEYTLGQLTTGIHAVASGRRFDDAANRNTLGGYGVVNLFASYRFSPDWQAELRWNNATNKQYALARTYATASSQVYAGLRYGIR